jgi:CheY-like chemotaxis protein
MKTILVIDDEEAIAEMICIFLEGEGYKTARARNGRQGLDYLPTLRPDVVICDVMMPILDGRELCKMMQANSDYRSIPIILMSAAIKSLKQSECHYAALLDKPFDLDKLLATVEQALKTVSQ